MLSARFMKITLGVASLSTCLVLGSAAAQTSGPTVLSATSSQCEIFLAISRVIPAECEPGYVKPKSLSRSLVRRNTKQAPPAPVVQDKPSESLVAAMTIRFAYDSAELTDNAMNVLSKLARVLRNELMEDIPFAIDGHADRSGDDEYNRKLSLKRAGSVRDFLVHQEGVDPSRFEVSGYGASRLLDRSDPFSHVNRRVEFRNLGG